MTIDNLLSGLLGAVIGLVGAVTIAWNERRQDVRAAARAVFMEVAANSAALVTARTYGLYAPVVSSTWAASHLPLSRGLSPAEFATVATFYMRVDAMIGAGFVQGESDSRLPFTASEMLTRSVMAAAILEAHGWSSAAERRALHDALAALAPEP